MLPRNPRLLSHSFGKLCRWDGVRFPANVARTWWTPCHVGVKHVIANKGYTTKYLVVIKSIFSRTKLFMSHIEFYHIFLLRLLFQ